MSWLAALPAIAGLAGSFLNRPGAPQKSAGSQMAEDEAYRQIQMAKAQEANQRAFGDQLYNQASGKAPSVAEMQMKAAQDRSLAQQIAMAKSNRSANAGLQSRNLQNSAAAQAGQVAQASGVARMQEQEQNQNAYAKYMQGLSASSASMMGTATDAAKASFEAGNTSNKNKNDFTGNLLGTASQLAGKFMGMKDDVSPAPVLDPTTAVNTIQGGSRFGQTASAGGYAHGGLIPGKAAVSGDSPANDTVPSMLSPGEIVIPRTIVAKGDKAVSAFVKALAEKEKESQHGYGAVLAAKSKMKKG